MSGIVQHGRRSLKARRLAAAIAAAGLGVFAGLSPLAAEPVGSGTFKGATGHSTTGSVTVTEKRGKYLIVLGRDFVFDGSPDPYVALGSGSGLVDGGLVAVLRSNTGKQRYSVKADGALKGATQVLIWCKKYSVPIGVASIR